MRKCPHSGCPSREVLRRVQKPVQFRHSMILRPNQHGVAGDPPTGFPILPFETLVRRIPKWCSIHCAP
jgi:hypothetical protein